MSLRINNNPNLSTVAGAFAHLTKVATGRLEIKNNAALVGFAGAFPELEEVADDVQIESSNIATLAGAFPALTLIKGTLHIESMPMLTTLASAFPALTQIEQTVSQLNGYVKFRNLPNLTTAAGAFPQVHQIQGLEIDNVGLTTLGAFPALVSLKGVQSGNVDTPGNPGVYNVPAFPGYLRIKNNDGLADLSSLSGLASIGQELLIDANAALDDVSVLQGVAGSSFTASANYASVTITNNPLLGQETQAQALINNYVGEGYVGVSTNVNNLFPPVSSDAFWRMEEIDTAAIPDSSLSGDEPLVISGSFSIVPGGVHGNRARVVAGTFASYNTTVHIDPNNWSITGWVQIDNPADIQTSNGATIFGGDQPSGSFYIGAIPNTPSTWKLGRFFASSFEPLPAVPFGEPVFFAFKNDGVNGWASVNGLPFVAVSVLFVPAGIIHVGTGYNAAGDLTGYLDDIQYYRRLLTNEEVAIESQR